MLIVKIIFDVFNDISNVHW